MVTPREKKACDDNILRINHGHRNYCLTRAFDAKTWEEYSEVLEQFFMANGVEDEGKQWAILISVVGPQTYSVIQTKPSEKTGNDAKKSFQSSAKWDCTAIKFWFKDLQK